MRALPVLALGFALVLSACGKQEGSATSTNGATQPANNGPVISGTVLSDKPAALASTATLNVRLLDVTRVDGEPMLIAEKTFPISAVPAEFQLPYNSADINSIRSYALEATVMDEGQVRYATTKREGVLTQGKPSRVNIAMVQALAKVEKDPIAEFKADYAEFERGLGGLKRFQDSRIVGPEGKQVAIGWDGFADDSGVRMVRELVSNPDGSRVNHRFAFRDGKLWVAASEAGGVTVQLGWDKEGTLLIKERNGAVDESVAEQADALAAAAKEAFDIASARVPK